VRSYRTLLPGSAGKPGSWAIPLFVLAAWLVAAILFAALSDWRPSISALVYGLAALFALVAVFSAARPESARRAVWILLGAALFFRLAGDASWGLGHAFGIGTPPLWAVYAVYGSSYFLFLAAMLRLVYEASRRIIFLVALDAASIMLSVGMLAWYFALGPATIGGSESWGASIAILSSFACGAGLLFICLTVLSAERRPSFAGTIAAAFGAFFIADGLYLAAHASGPYEPGGWPEMLWALGLLLFGVCASRATPGENTAREEEIHPWRVFSFWFGPLSPAVHFAFLLGWGATEPPLPSYVLWGGAAITLYLAFRISFTAYISRGMRLDSQSLAVRGEQGRISEELHDTLRQSVYGVSTLLDAYKTAKEKEDPDAETILADAIAASRDANFQVGRPIDELRARWAGEDQDPSPLLGRLLTDFESHFGIRPHEDLRADLTRLCPEELAAAYRIASEALWNAARHSGARNVWLESREVGPSTIVRIRDDGRGFGENIASGYGLSMMRDRAESSGGSLDIISDSLSGTTVQIRFEK
jgi:signal transduction histidine kinase